MSLTFAKGDICLDTNVLADVLVQYYQDSASTGFRLRKSRWVSLPVARICNRIISFHTSLESTLSDSIPGLVIASPFAFVELARKFDEITKGQLTIYQLAAFLAQPPDWFQIEPIGLDVLTSFFELPVSVLMESKLNQIEGTDNLHVATACVRESCLLATTDERLVAAYEKLVVKST